MYVVYLAAAALIGAVINILFFGAPLADALLAWLLGVQVGLGAIWAFLGHYFKSDEVAAYIGWPPGNPFQKEIAFTNLALGLCGVLSFLLRNTPCATASGWPPSSSPRSSSAARSRSTSRTARNTATKNPAMPGLSSSRTSGCLRCFGCCIWCGRQAILH
nr:DUF6790 family protein [Pseudodesulfovibrio indicus]